jgi:general secretion pathway protein D
MTAHPAVLTAQAPPGRQAGANMVPLAFNNADIYSFTNTMAGLLGLTPILVDSAVQGTVDFNGTIPRDDLFDIFNGILKSRGAALVRQNSLYQVVPISAAIRSDLEIIETRPPPGEGTAAPGVSPVKPSPKQDRIPETSRGLLPATHVIRLDFVPVEDVVEAVRLFVSDNVPIITFKRQNLMIITDYSDNAARIRDFIRMLDNSYLDSNLVELVKIENSNAVDIADELKKIFGSSAADNAATGVSFVPLERLNAIFVMAASRRGLDAARNWILELDTYDGSKYQTYTYIVQDSTASNIADMLLALYGDGSAGSSTSTNRTAQGTSGTGSSGSLINQMLGSDGGSSFGSAQQLGPRLNTSSSSVSSIILSGGEFSNLRDIARIVVDDTNNVLHIQSTPADYRSLLGAIEKMDVAPRQVYIEAQILEVDLTNELSYGFRAWMEERTEGNLTTAGLGDSVNGLLSFGTFAYVGNSRQIMLALDALKTKTNVRVLQQPTVTAMDGTQARFVSGAEVPYPTESYTTTSGSSTGINYRETGVSLIVVPKISASGSVTMEIVQEVSSVSTQTVAGLQAPIFPATNVQTTLSVKDGQTVAIAGLITDNREWIRGGIPFLSDIPFIGGLFGGTNSKKSRTELIILITPHVIRTQESFKDFTQSMFDSLRNVRKLNDEYEKDRIRDIEDARQDREKKELSDIREIRAPK